MRSLAKPDPPRSLGLCDKRRELKQKRNEAEGVKQYRAVNRKIKDGMKRAKENWIENQCQDIEDSLKKNNSKQAYQLVKDLTSIKQGKATTIPDKEGNCLTKEREKLKRWTEYCPELYNRRTTGDPEILNVPPSSNTESDPIFRE